MSLEMLWGGGSVFRKLRPQDDIGTCSQISKEEYLDRPKVRGREPHTRETMCTPPKEKPLRSALTSKELPNKSLDIHVLFLVVLIYSASLTLFLDPSESPKIH